MSSTPPPVSPDLTDTCQSDRYAENDKSIPLLCLVTDHTEPSEDPRNVIIKINGIRWEGAGGGGGRGAEEVGGGSVFFFYSFSLSSVICVTHGFLNRPQFSVLELFSFFFFWPSVLRTALSKRKLHQCGRISGNYTAKMFLFYFVKSDTVYEE